MIWKQMGLRRMQILYSHLTGLNLSPWPEPKTNINVLLGKVELKIKRHRYIYTVSRSKLTYMARLLDGLRLMKHDLKAQRKSPLFERVRNVKEDGGGCGGAEIEHKTNNNSKFLRWVLLLYVFDGYSQGSA